MNELIDVGDMAVVVKPCPYCGSLQWLGRIFKVEEIEYLDDPTDCCGWTDEDLCVVSEAIGYEIETVKRIPPLDELEGVKSEEDMPIKEKVW